MINTPLNILHVVGSMDPAKGGISEGIRNITSYIYDLGYHCEVVCLDDPKTIYLPVDRIPIHAVGPSKGPWQYSPKLKHWLFENLDRFDVIVINGLWIHCCYLTWRLLKKIRKKATNNNSGHPRLFVMPHGMLDPYFQLAFGRKIKAARNWLYFQLLEKKILNDADGVFFTTESELMLARQTFRSYHPKKEVNIGYGIVPPPAFNHAMSAAFYKTCPRVSGKPYLLFLGRIDIKKGVDILIQSYVALAKERVAVDLPLPPLVIAGPGLETEFGKKMIELARSETGLDEQIFFTGMLTGDAKWGAFYNSQAFILPSHQENFGIAVAEAMACQKPVLISDQVNIMNEVKQNNAGLVAPDTIEGTTKLITRWLNTPPANQTEMAGNAVQTFAKQFDIQISATNFIKAIST